VERGMVGGMAMALHGVSNMQIACGSLRFFAFNECPAYSLLDFYFAPHSHTLTRSHTHIHICVLICKMQQQNIHLD